MSFNDALICKTKGSGEPESEILFEILFNEADKVQKEIIAHAIGMAATTSDSETCHEFDRKVGRTFRGIAEFVLSKDHPCEWMGTTEEAVAIAEGALSELEVQEEWSAAAPRSHT
jgi:hypothetical protein